MTDETELPETVKWDDLLAKAKLNREVVNRTMNDPAMVEATALRADEAALLDLMRTYAKQEGKGLQEVAEQLYKALLG